MGVSPTTYTTGTAFPTICLQVVRNLISTQVPHRQQQSVAIAINTNTIDTIATEEKNSSKLVLLSWNVIVDNSSVCHSDSTTYD